MNSSQPGSRKKRRIELSIRKRNAKRTKAGLSHNQEEARLASHFRRLIAYAIDQFLAILFIFLYIVVISLVSSKPSAFFTNIILPLSIFGVGYISYSLGIKGATLGYKLMDIVVIDKSGDKMIGYQRALIRWFVLYGVTLVIFAFIPTSISTTLSLIFGIVIGSFSIVMYLPAFFSPTRQGLHDRIAQSVVIYNRKLLEAKE